MGIIKVFKFVFSYTMVDNDSSIALTEM